MNPLEAVAKAIYEVYPLYLNAGPLSRKITWTELQKTNDFVYRDCWDRAYKAIKDITT